MPSFYTTFLEWRGIRLALHHLGAPAEAGQIKRRGSLLLLHATGFPSGAYLPLLERFGSEGLDAWALDFSGHGDSEAVRPQSWADFGDQALHALRFLLAEQVTGQEQPLFLAGHSLGGAAALLAAAQCTDRRLRALALFDPTVFSPWLSYLLPYLPHPLARQALRRRERFASRALVERAYLRSPTFRAWDRACFQSYLDCALKEDGAGGMQLRLSPELEAQTFLSFQGGQWRSHRKVLQPMLLLRAQASGVCPPRAARLLCRGHSASRHETLPAASHFFPFESPQRTVEKTLAFLKPWTTN
ncbi:MAG: alpha/beta hydrolase [Leptospirales bacterium]|nr:alpha/beta hydrolase [Leptospirales bacterium]